MRDKPMSWNELRERPEWRDAALLDIRAAAAYDAGHLPGSVSIPLDPDAPEAVFQDRLAAIFLPPRRRPLVVVDDDRQRLSAAIFALKSRDRGPVGAVLLEAGDPLSETGANDRVLWSPPAYLGAHIDLLPPPGAGPVLDLAAGSGRASIWLAQRGYRVTAVDHLPDALVMAERLAADRGVRIETLQRDLSRPGSLPDGPWSVAMAFRFLDRRMLGALPGVLAPGGVVVVRTFRWDPKAEILPKRRHCLEDGELPGLFPAPAWEILHHVEDRDPDGRPAAGITVRYRG